MSPVNIELEVREAWAFWRKRSGEERAEKNVNWVSG